MSSLNKVVPSNGDARSMLPSKVTALNPNAAEFVPSCVIRPSFGGNADSDVTKSEIRGSSGKTILDRSESSKSNNSDDEAHQFWRKQLPDDIIPDFTSFEKIEQEPEELSLAGLSLNAPPFYGTKASRLSREHQELSSTASNIQLGHSNLLYEDNSQATFSTVGSSNWEQNYMGDLHFANENQDLHYDADSFASEYVAASDGLFDPLEYLASQFPGFSAESLAELYYANGCDFNHTIEILTQLEVISFSL
jgi:hypothetical protein